MQPILSTDNNTQQITNARPEINGFKTKKPVINEEKIVLPVEMASMVPLKTLIGKMIYKSHADLMTLTDTLPSMSDVEKKRQILNYATFVRKQFLKLLVLVKWAKNARDIQMCQNIMAFLANQNQIFQITTDYLHKIHVELPAARLREFDIDTAVDVLSTGTYQQMPSKTKDLFAVTPLSDAAVLETFQNMNDLIRMRMLTTEVLPLPMQHYRIENGRIYLKIENEFEVTLTLTGQGEDKKWWIVSLDIFVEATEGNGGEDVDFALNDKQKQHLRMNAQKQLTPPDDSDKHKFMFFPLVNLYDYLHLCCLNMQLEILYIQSAILSKTRWINQLKVQMDADRSKLTLIYWGGESAVSKWARPHCDEKKSTTVEISINNEQEKQTKDMNITVRDEFKGLIQKAGIGASVALSDISLSDRTKVITSLKYPKNDLEIVWGGSNDLYTTRKLLDPLQLNVEKLVQHITNYHGKHIIDKFRTLLESQKEFLEENGLYLAEENIEVDKDTFRRPTLIIRYRHQKYVSIETDARTGRVKASEASDGCSEGDVILRSLEERLQTDPANIARHLIWLRSEVVIREVISLAKQLNLQSYHPSQINLRPDDIIKLFGDSSLKPEEKAKTSLPPHCVFLQFPQFEEWYFVIAIIKNEFRSCLCCLNKIYDQSNLYQGIVDVIYIDCDQMWRDQFMPSETVTATNKRRLSCTAEHTPALKRRKTSAIEQMTAVDK
ncbi:mediator complex subunit MED14-domain-containing protein [Pilobolus umbonatus]|nr:mediator complex subunit MED14-domain-containing protein [Pilobolus umbonatus]